MSIDLQHSLERLVLGSAQFGLDYGISNTHGKVPFEEVKRILAKAREAGITTLDTATAYGDSELTIGKALQELQLTMNIITKFPSGTSKGVGELLNESLQRLQVDKVHGYLLHSFSVYKENPGILKKLQELKSVGKVDKIGISIYHPYEAEELLEQHEQLDMLQFPYNVFDQRFETILPKLAANGIKTHIRSVFLQGLFFLNQEKLLAKFGEVVALKIKALHQIAQEENVPLGAMLLGFVLANPHVSKVILGIENEAHLTENIRFFQFSLTKKVIDILRNCKETNENIILPYNW